MREIKFRGLRTDGKGWCYGYYFIDLENKKSYMHLTERKNNPEEWMVKCYEVITESVGQFTGLKDKNGKEIYENDLVQDAVLIFKVEWNQQNSKFCINPVGRVDGDFDGIIESIMYADLGNGYYSRKDLEIIGNIYENPELLK